VTAAVAALALVLALNPAVSAATPNPNSAIFNLRVFNDCATSVVSTVDSYPALLAIEDQGVACGGFANLHNWRYSEDDANAAVFNNDSNFRIKADLVISGAGDAESGLQIAPWWSQNVDGRLNVRTTDGEIACFGGRLPFYSFTGNHGLHYVKGDVITLEIIYLANGLTELNPATIQYNVTYGGTPYTSGALPFDEGNPNEPYGTWGILDDARVGAHLQVFWANHADDAVRAEWSNVEFEVIDPTAVEPTSWGKVKSLYR
jgi:hypothetical protein